MTDTVRPTETQAWQALKAHYEEIKGAHLRQLFADDSARADSFSAEGAGLFLDYSKNRLTAKTIQLLLQLAKERGVEARRDAMFRGEQDQPHRKASRAACSLARPQGRVHPRGRPGRGAAGPRRAGQDDGILPIASGAAPGWATPAGALKTSSTSASAAPTWGRRWRIWRSVPSATAPSPAASFLMWMAPTSQKPPTTWTPARPFS